jgi:hypothetical protein
MIIPLPNVIVNEDASESVVTKAISLSIPPPDVVVSVDRIDETEGTGSPNQPKEARIFKRVKLWKRTLILMQPINVQFFKKRIRKRNPYFQFNSYCYIDF